MTAAAEGDELIASLTDTSLYSIGAYFTDQHPELVDDVLAQSLAIEDRGLVRWSDEEGSPLEGAFQTLITGLAIRYFKAVAGSAT